MKYPSRLFISAVLFFLLSCGNKQQQAGGPGTGGSGANAVKDYPVLTIAQQSTTLYADYPATIQGQQNVEIRPKIDGYIDRIYVDEGATVRQGQPLFQISAPQYEQEVRTASANIKIAQANVNAAQMDVNKVRPLVEKNILSQYELQSAQYTLQSRQAALAQAAATYANAQTNLGYTRVASPVNGIVGSIPYKIGSLVSSNTAQPLTTVSNVGNIYAYFSINEKQALQFSQTAKGATIAERVASLPPVSLILADGSVYPQQGRIETASGQINTATGAVSVRATFPNPNNLIRSGSTGSVRIPRTVDSAILIPQKSTYEIQGKLFVYLLGDSNKVRSVSIAVLPNSGGQYYVVQQGLRAGDRVVVEGVASLREGAAVRPRLVNADSLYQQLKQSSAAAGNNAGNQ